MKNDPQIREGTTLLLMAILPQLFLSFLPRTVAATGGAVWIAQLIAWGVSVLFLSIALRLMKHRPGKSLIGVLREMLGEGVGTVLSFLMLLYFVLRTAAFLDETVGLIRTDHFPRTPFGLLVFGFLAVAWLLGRYGINGIAETAERFRAAVLLGIAVILLIGLKEYDFRRLFPMGGYGLLRTGTDAAQSACVYSEAFLLLMSAPFGTEQHKLRRALGGGMIWCGAAAVLCSLGYLFTFGYESSSGKTVGLVEIVKNVHFNQLFQRMEAVFFLIMIICCAVGVCIRMQLLLIGYAELFGIEAAQMPTIPLYLTVFAWTVLCRLHGADGNGVDLLCFGGWGMLLCLLLLLPFARCKRRASRHG